MAQEQASIDPIGRTVVDRLSFLGFVAAAACLVFLAGLMAAIADLPPAGLVRDAAIAARSLMEQESLLDQAYSEWLWTPADRQERGLVQHDPSASFEGYTVYTSGHTACAVVVDMDGHEVHRWEKSFSAVWPNATHVSGRAPDGVIYIRRVHIEPDGDVVALYETNVDTPFGYGLAKLDRQGNVLWTYDANAHHDFSVGEDGTIYVLIQEIRTSPIAGWPQLQTPVLEEFVAILTPDGGEIERISLLDALIGTPFFRTKAILPAGGDTLHSNTVSPVSAGFASHHKGVEAGDLMVCLRNLNLVAIIGRASRKIVWATTGPWHFPHDPDPLESGRIMIFDNIFAGGPTAGSRVVEFDPARGQIGWAWGGTEREPLRSDVRAASQQLPNGNVLITETDHGRIVEVTRDGRIVWEYINPVRGGEAQELVPIVCGVRRYSASDLPFLAEREVASRRAARGRLGRR